MNKWITEEKKFDIEMEEKLMETIEAFGEELEGEVTSPAQHHLFYVNEDAKLLDKIKQNIFTAWQKAFYK